MAKESASEVMRKSSKLERIGLSSQSRWALFFKCALFVWLVLFLLEILILFIEPRLYLGRMRLQIHPVSQDYEVFRNNSTKPLLPPAFIQTQFQIITSKETLYDAIEQLQLVKKWEHAKSSSDAYGLLLNKLEVEEVRGTDMIDIEIYHTDPHEAADLANAIGQAYKNRRNQIETSRAHAALDMLNAQISLQKQKVEDIRQQMIELMEKYDIVDLGDATFAIAGSPYTPTEDAFAEAVAQFHARQRTAAEMLTQVEAIKGLDEKLRMQWMLKSNMLPDAAKDAYEESAAMDGQLTVRLASGMVSETDAEIIELKKSVQVKREILTKATTDAMELLEAEAGIATLTAQRSHDSVDELKFTMSNDRKNYFQYQNAKSIYSMNLKLLADMRRALLEEKIDISLPRYPIEIHEQAEPNEVPARPRVPLALTLNAALNLLWCIPGGLIVMYFTMVFSAWRYRATMHPDHFAEAFELNPEQEADVPPQSEIDDKW